LRSNGHSTYVTLERMVSHRLSHQPQQSISYPIYALRISANTPAPPATGTTAMQSCSTAPATPASGSPPKLPGSGRLPGASPHRYASGVPELLSYADVWIIPMVNPAGRTIDDQSGGDPTHSSLTRCGWQGLAQQRRYPPVQHGGERGAQFLARL